MWYALAGLLFGVLTGTIATLTFQSWQQSQSKRLSSSLRNFLDINDAIRLIVKDRNFPTHAAPDAKQGLDKWLNEHDCTSTVVGVPITNSFMQEVTISSLISPPSDEEFRQSAVEYSSFDIGEEETVECPRHVVWLVEHHGRKCVILWTSYTTHSRSSFVNRLRIELGYLEESLPQDFVDGLFSEIEQAIQQGQTYRGKVISLEEKDSYRGDASGITVHRLRQVSRDEIILPKSTVALLERNVIRFAEQREAISRHGLPVKKGVLFYGPPGTGKTHTIHYLIGALEGHTTLLITAEQIGSIEEYLTLARLLQPSVVIMEDVDLIATQRDESSPCQQTLLNRLLNEMDGLGEDAAILFILTTNRPEALETALAARPGRIDQAVEFPLPDSEGREKLIQLYTCGTKVADEVVNETIRRTEGVSAAFIKELARRALQFNLECQPNSEEPELLWNDFEQAIEEMLWAGGPLNRKLLGAEDYRE